MLKNRLTDVLEKKSIAYEVIHHRPDYSALETAQDTHTAGHEFAKSVMLATADGPVMAVVPAPRVVNIERFARVVGSEDVHLLPEGSLAQLFPDCQLGAEPPFGHLYGLPVYVDESLACEEFITFNAGSHDEAIRIRYRDYERLEHPTHGHFATPRA